MFPGPQWYCPKCGSGQHGSHRYCSNCGGAAPLRAASGCLGSLERDPNEREARRERYVVTMGYESDDRTVRFVVPDEKSFRKFVLSSRHAITPTSDYVEVNGVRYYHP
jgi:hypothetical protein